MIYLWNSRRLLSVSIVLLSEVDSQYNNSNKTELIKSCSSKDAFDINEIDFP